MIINLNKIRLMKIILLNLLLIGSVLMPVSSIGSDEGGEKPESIEGSSNTTNDEGTFIDSRDGKTYKWVKFGNKKWMVENLQYVPSEGNFWVYDNNTSNISKYGYLYDWETSKTVAPEGWHLPNDSEWSELVSNFETNSLNYDTVFYAQYGGYNDNSYYKSIDVFGMWWSNDEKKENIAIVYYISSDYNGLGKSGYGKTLGLSIRCVKD